MKPFFQAFLQQESQHLCKICEQEGLGKSARTMQMPELNFIQNENLRKIVIVNFYACFFVNVYFFMLCDVFSL